MLWGYRREKEIIQTRMRLGQEKWGRTLEPKLWCVKEHGTFWNGEWVGFMSPWELEGVIHVTFICFNFFLHLFFHFFSFVVPIIQLVHPSINYLMSLSVGANETEIYLLPFFIWSYLCVILCPFCLYLSFSSPLPHVYSCILKNRMLWFIWE